MAKDTLELVKLITQTIYDKKGSNLIAVDVREVSSLTDYCIITEGTVDRHVKALGQAVVKRLKECGLQPIHVDGMQEGDWVVLDYHQIMVHIFVPRQREKYQIERLWEKGIILDLSLQEAS